MYHSICNIEREIRTINAYYRCICVFVEYVNTCLSFWPALILSAALVRLSIVRCCIVVLGPIVTIVPVIIIIVAIAVVTLPPLIAIVAIITIIVVVAAIVMVTIAIVAAGIMWSIAASPWINNRWC